MNRQRRRALLRVLESLDTLTTAIPNAEAGQGTEARNLIDALDHCATAVEEFSWGIRQRYGKSMTSAEAGTRVRHALDGWEAHVRVGRGGADYLDDADDAEPARDAAWGMRWDE